MINPQKPVIKLIKFFYHFTTLVLIQVGVVLVGLVLCETQTVLAGSDYGPLMCSNITGSICHLNVN